MYTPRVFFRASIASVIALVSVTVWAAPYPDSTVITGITFDGNTLETRADGSDNFPITWADDDHQYTSWGDGDGFNGSTRGSLGVSRITGSKDSFSGDDLFQSGFASGNGPPTDGKSYGIISIGGDLYMWVSPGSGTTGYEYAKVWKSTNKGNSWSNSGWQFDGANAFGNGNHAFFNPTFLQFGKDYAGARDNFVYIYANELKSIGNKLEVQKPGEVSLLRVPKDKIMDRNSYEFFAGVDGNNNPSWTSDIADREPVFQDSDGVGWNISAAYNAPLDRYLLVTEHTASRDSNIGIFDAPTPWGPWTTVLYDVWPVSGIGPKNHFFWNFSNKWLSADGKRFVIIATGVGTQDRWSSVEGDFIVDGNGGGADTTAPNPPTNLLAD